MQRNNQQRRGNSRTGPNFRMSQNNKRTAIRPRRVARQNDLVHTRTFRAISRIFLQSTDTTQGGVESFFNFTTPVEDYTGADFVKNNYEQFRVKNVKITMKPSTATLNNGEAPTTTQESIIYQNSVYSLMNNTEVQSFVDYDTVITPQSYASMLARPNLKFRALAPNNWTQVASFVPKTLTNPSFTGTAPSITFGANTWMSTENTGALLHSLRGRVSNRSPIFNTQDNVASVDVMLTILVEMRGPKNDPSNLSNLTLVPNGARSLTEREEEEQERMEVDEIVNSFNKTQ